MLEAFALLVMFGTGFTAGMYVTTQVESWKEKRINKNKDE